ncbi:MAG: ATP-binding protein [Pseudomonadota bacterium]|nr:ATP-binding protein [Pseudomonadota bacterium]
MRKLKKLPIGIQTFSKIREDDFLYIDKTQIALDVIENNQYVFLSRPRRFGKSLFLDTLKNIFMGNKDLFKGLYIDDKYDFSRTFPVINISFAKGKFKNREQLKKKIISILEYSQKDFGVECKEPTSPDICFEDLIRKVYEKYQQKVVILIDEYDKPLLDTLEDPQIAGEMRDELVNFYSVIKGSDEYLRFAFLTGVSKFAKVSVFSGLNNIKDISLSEQYGDICGYTQHDIETSFLPYLEGVDFEKLKEWYNGYNFLGSNVYNPFDILLFISENFKYDNYWFETGTPTFLIHLLKQKNYFIPELENLTVGKELVSSFDVEKIALETILFQAGYLTIDKLILNPISETYTYKLKIPNKEVRISLNNMMINYLTDDISSKVKKQENIIYALFDADFAKLEQTLVSLFASIPYHNFTNNKIHQYEGYYASVIYAYFASLGLPIKTEDPTNLGRIDITLEVGGKIFIIEFKVTEEDALAQIKEKNYALKYTDEGKDIYLVGINFDRKKRNISRFHWEKFQG